MSSWLATSVHGRAPHSYGALPRIWWLVEPLADLYAHSLWALLERRGRLLEADPQFARSLAGGVEALLAEGDLSVQSRRELEQVHYGVRLLTKS